MKQGKKRMLLNKLRLLAPYMKHRKQALRKFHAGQGIIPILQDLWIELYDKGYKHEYRRIAMELQVWDTIQKIKAEWI